MFVLFLIFSGASLVAGLVSLRVAGRNDYERGAWSLFCVFNSLWFYLAGQTPLTSISSIHIGVQQAMLWSGTVLLAGIYLLLLRKSLMVERWNQLPHVLIPVGAGVLVILAATGVSDAEFVRQTSGIGLVVIYTFSFGELASATNQTKRPSMRNRQAFLLSGLVPMAICDVLFIFLPGSLPAIARFIAYGWAWYHTIPVRLPDFQRMNYRILRGTIMGALMAVVWIMGFSLYVSTQDEPFHFPGDYRILIFVILISAAATPLIFITARWLRNILPDKEIFPLAIARTYSLEISQMPEIETLAQRACTLIAAELGAEYVALFNVEKLINADEHKYVLSGYQKSGDISLPTLHLNVSEALAEQMEASRKLLLWTDLVLKTQFSPLRKDTEAWLEKLQVEVILPIHVRGEWMGLFCLGKRKSDWIYHQEEITLLETLADQTAVALENSRLFAGINRLNQEYRRAYAALDNSNAYLQEVLKQLEQLDQAKSNFINILSHELRTPLTIINGYTELLKDELKDQPAKELEIMAKGLGEGTERLAEIIELILDMASIDTEAIPMTIETVKVSVLVDELQKKHQEALVKRNIKFSTDGLEKLPIVISDQRLLHKALEHLLLNAIKYTQDGGSIMIGGKVINDTESPLGELSVQLVVEDSGIGIDPEELGLIFNKFYQPGGFEHHSSGKTKYKGGGPGLGLAIVRGIIQQLHGKVWAESKGRDENVPPGSKFYLVLPQKWEKTGIKVKPEFLDKPEN